MFNYYSLKLPVDVTLTRKDGEKLHENYLLYSG